MLSARHLIALGRPPGVSFAKSEVRPIFMVVANVIVHQSLEVLLVSERPCGPTGVVDNSRPSPPQRRSEHELLLTRLRPPTRLTWQNTLYQAMDAPKGMLGVRTQCSSFLLVHPFSFG